MDSVTKIRIALRDVASKYGFEPDWLDSIAYVESRWRPLVNKAGPDGLVGGAYGPTQITERTARAYGYTDAMDVLLDVDKNVFAELSGKIMAAGSPKGFADACAWWNAGRKLFSSLPENHRTVIEYWPRAQAALAVVKANPIEATLVVAWNRLPHA